MSTHDPDDHSVGTAETNRREAETTRERREHARQAEEVARQEQERHRTAAEHARASAEQVRAAAETDRQVTLQAVRETADTLHQALNHMRRAEELRRALRDAATRTPEKPNPESN